MSHTPRNEAKLIDILQRQFEATLEMLGRVIDECPDEVWDVQEEPAPIWQQLYHSLIGLDFWIRDPESAFQPQPFHTDEAGMLKGRAEPTITRQQIAAYRDLVFNRCQQVFDHLTPDGLVRDVDAGGVMLTLADHVLDQIRHVHHHVGSMHSQLRRRTGSHPIWVSYNERAFRAAQDAG
jgi:hypothetical protein